MNIDAILEIVSPREIEAIARQIEHLSPDAIDEMAVPTYTHRNPLARWIFWRRHRRILKFCLAGKSERVLDFGTGTGALLPSLCKISGAVHATDLHDEIARKLAENRKLAVDFHPAGALDHALDDNSLDVVIAADVLEHIQEPGLSGYLRLFRKKLSSDGKLIVSIPTENMIYKLGRIVAGFGKKGEYHKTGIKELRRAAEDCGYRETDFARIPLSGPGCLFFIACYQKI